jgi:hypothetical protein
MRYFICCALAGLLSAGCVSDIGSAAHKLGMQRIQVDPTVPVQQRLRFGYDTESHDVNAQVDSLITDELQGQRKQMAAFESVMATNEIRIPDLVRERATALLRDAGKLEIVADTNTADGTFMAIVEQYGFGGIGFKNSRYIPFIVLRGQLVDRKGKLVWSSRGRTHPIVHDDVSAKFDVYAASPDLLRNHWEHQIERTLKKMLAGKKYDATHLLFAAPASPAPPPPAAAAPVHHAGR